jgi:hypothetical protein
MTVVQNSILTIAQRVAIANDLITNWSSSNVYLGIGAESPYAANDSLVPLPNQSIAYQNEIYRNLIALKKVTAASISFMVPRVDWSTGVTYSQWDDQTDMYSTTKFIALSGNVSVSNSRTLIGANTTFTTQISPGNLVYVAGDGEIVGPQILQVTDIFSNTSLNVNTAFVGNIVSNTLFLVNETAPSYAKNFYTRNAYDQVFICLFNNGGVPSTVMPQLSLGGDLPENPYIITSDGYKWKYLYTIPAGQKQLFFSSDWMPVFSDPVTVENALNGRLDVVLIQNGGSGYNQNVASNTASILTVVGDGTGANLSAKVSATGTIFDINVLNGGQNYTTANIVVTAGTTGVGANLRAIIGPQGGHGFNPVEELGATTLMISIQLSGTEGGTLPTGASVGTGVFDYRQLVLVQDPVLRAGGIASNTNYGTVTTVSVQTLPAGQFFSIDETVYQGSSLNSATFVGTVVFWDDTNDVLWLNNTSGTFTPQAPIVGTIQTSPVTAFIITNPLVAPFTGRILYVNNVLPVIRGVNQTEQVRLILSF